MEPARHFLLLARAAAADGRIGTDERAMLLRSAPRLGVPKDEAYGLLEEAARGGRLSVEIPESASEREALLLDLAAVVAADGRVVPQERAIFGRIGGAFGVPPPVLEGLLADAVRGRGSAPDAACSDAVPGWRPPTIYGSEPPPAPRAVPGGVLHLAVMRSALTSLPTGLALVGAAVAVCGALAMWQPGWGAEPALMLALGLAAVVPVVIQAAIYRNALRDGDGALAELLEVRKVVHRRRKGGWHTYWLVIYRYDAAGRTHHGRFRWHGFEPAWSARDRMWIVLDRRDPTWSVPWAIV